MTAPPCHRRPGDYKPWAAVLGNGDLLIVAFASAPAVNGKPPHTEEHAVFFRSTDMVSFRALSQQQPVHI